MARCRLGRPAAVAAREPVPGQPPHRGRQLLRRDRFRRHVRRRPAWDLAAAWILLPDGAVGHFHQAYQPTADAPTLRRARGWAVVRAMADLFIGDAGDHGRSGGKPTWGPPARASCGASP
jgi:hypothetical protein